MSLGTTDINPIVLIPACMTSNRLPNKPMMDIGGAPMIVQVWRRAMEAGIGPVLVAADSHENRASHPKCRRRRSGNQSCPSVWIRPDL